MIWQLFYLTMIATIVSSIMPTMISVNYNFNNHTHYVYRNTRHDDVRDGTRDCGSNRIGIMSPPPNKLERGGSKKNTPWSCQMWQSWRWIEQNRNDIVPTQGEPTPGWGSVRGKWRTTQEKGEQKATHNHKGVKESWTGKAMHRTRCLDKQNKPAQKDWWDNTHLTPQDRARTRENSGSPKTVYFQLSPPL